MPEDHGLSALSLAFLPQEDDTETLHGASKLSLATKLVEILDVTTGSFRELENTLPGTRTPALAHRGTGLWAFEPGSMSATLRRLDPQTGEVWRALEPDVHYEWPDTWAYAGWGARDYLFAGQGSSRSSALRYTEIGDKTEWGGSVASQYQIIGASVSTCVD